MGRGLRLLLAVIAVLALAGVLLLIDAKGLEDLPGNVEFRRDGTRYYAPVGLMVVVSVILTILLNVARRR